MAPGSGGTAGSLQPAPPLGPIYIVVRSNYSEAPHGPLPKTCNSSDPAQLQISLPWDATFTFYTCT